ncbi:hypothetical protein V5799_012905 [Amblyomma americanum]|uniref:Uncharacterized protein n=1 Tax=Amblyomma americanum TaxID=6943 RepID=A0AAQ4E7I7_AMBAM
MNTTITGLLELRRRKVNASETKCSSRSIVAAPSLALDCTELLFRTWSRSHLPPHEKQEAPESAPSSAPNATRASPAGAACGSIFTSTLVKSHTDAHIAARTSL